MNVERQKPWCIAPFIGTFKTPVRTSPCCEMPANLGGHEFDEYWNGDFMKNLRKSIHNFDWDSLPDTCKVCQNSPTSHSEFYFNVERPFFYDSYKDHIHLLNDDGSMDSSPLTYAALGISNECNYACRMCYPGISSTRYRLEEETGILAADEPVPEVGRRYVSTQSIDSYVKIVEDNYDTLREVVIHGGDPVQANGLPELLDALEPIKDKCKINFLSNGSVEKMVNGENVWERLCTFKDLHVVFSVDGVKDVNEYVRVGARHERILKLIWNAKNILPDESYIGVHTTLSNYTAMRFAEYLEYAEREFMDNDIWVSLNVVNGPLEYRPSQLPNDIKRQVLMDLNRYDSDHWHFKEMKQWAIKAIMSNPFDQDQWDKLIHKESQIDRHRSIDPVKAFPMLDPYIPKMIQMVQL